MKSFLVLAMGLGFGGLAFASVGIDAYRSAALADAARTVRNRGSLRANLSVNAEMIRQRLGFGRFYKTGDSWLVAVRRLNLGMVHMADDAAAHRDSYLPPVFYRFNVTSSSATKDVAVVEVLQVDETGKPSEGARVRKMTMTVNRKLQIVEKSYFYRDLKDPVRAEFSADRSIPVGFNSFPVDLPDLARARALSQAIRLAPSFQGRFATRVLDPAETIRFESPDLLERPMRVAWQRGDLWPAIIESHGGLTTLVSQEKQQ